MKKIMSLQTYSKINRYLDADMPKIRVQVPSLFRKYWNMYPKACIDDNLHRWTGKGFHKQKIVIFSKILEIQSTSSFLFTTGFEI